MKSSQETIRTNALYACQLSIDYYKIQLKRLIMDKFDPRRWFIVLFFKYLYLYIYWVGYKKRIL